LPQTNPSKITPALKKTTVAISEIYGCSPAHVWATWEEIKPNCYIEGGVESDRQSESTHPPICELICFEGKSPEEIEKILLVAAVTLSNELGIPNNIFMTYKELKAGQVIAGDGVLKTGAGHHDVPV